MLFFCNLSHVRIKRMYKYYIKLYLLSEDSPSITSFVLEHEKLY